MPTASPANLHGTTTALVQDTPVDVTRLIYMLYQDVEQQISRADLKAQLTLSTSALLMAIIVKMDPGLRLHSWANMQIFEHIVLVLYSLFVLSISFTSGWGIAAAFPRAIKKTADTNQHPNLYFSGQIIKINGNDYADLFCEQSNDGVKRSVLGQIHSKCIVLEAKLNNVRKGMTGLVIALIFWISARLVLLIGNGFNG
jgi:hypothetical protein